VKYTQEGGQVNLQVSGTQEHLTITVKDNGPGLTTEQQTQLFKPFLHGEVSRGDMGIGLYTAYQSARLHYGSLGWTPAIPHGSVFTLSLPMDASCYAPEEYVARRVNSPQDNAQSTQAATPVILLTALDDEAHQIKGYQAGADDYMVKPCNYRILIARMISLIKWRQEQKAKEQKEEQGNAPSNAAESSTPQTQIIETRADLLFRQQVETLVNKHLCDPALSVDMLAELMHIGRTRFYGKVRDIFGMSPNKYITNQRLERAAELLVEGRYNVTEVAYQVGFATPTYFYKCFKQKYGVMPSKYKG
jgi:YesN/AraC family two-component response regulator